MGEKMDNKYLLLVLLFFTFPAIAAESYGPTAEEAKFLPPYCRGSGGGDWQAILGPEGGWNNHTCYGINRINRYYKNLGAKNKNEHLEIAIGDFNYSVGHISQGFILMPEIYYYRGLTYKLLGKNAEAISDFSKSVSLDPKYSKSVGELASLYEGSLANKKKALELVMEGLRHNPNSKELKRRFTKLGGQLPFPEPYVQSGEQTASAKPDASRNAPSDSTSASTSAAKKDVVGPPEKAPEVAPASVPASADAAMTDKPAAKSPQPALGSPSNPWCRFCPDAKPLPGPETSTPQAAPKAAR